MRLGRQPCFLREGSRARECYGEAEIEERHRHRYEFNPDYRSQFENAGLIPSGTSPDGSLVEVVEIPDHPWYVAVQYHPEFKKQAAPAASVVPRFRRSGDSAPQATVASWGLSPLEISPRSLTGAKWTC